MAKAPRSPAALAQAPLDRAFAVLTFIAEQKKAVSAAEVATALELPLPTAHRLLGNLEDRALVQKALGTKRYMVGNRLVVLAGKVIGSTFRTARRHAVLTKVAGEIGEQCEIGIVRDNEVAYVDSVRVRPPQGLQFDPGGGAPLHCTSTGKIYMSRLPPRAREKLVRSLPLAAYTDNTVTDAKKLLGILDQTRTRGWAKTDEEFVKGVVGCAVPIVAPGGDLIACLGISVPVARVSFSALDAYIPPLQRAAMLLSETILQSEVDFEN